MQVSRKVFQILTVTMTLSLLTPGCIILEYFGDRRAVPLEESSGKPHTPTYQLGDLTVARASMHNHTVYSDGYRTPEDLLQLARREGMAILAYSDHREGNLCVNKVCMTFNGIEKVGYQTYFDHLNRIKESAGDMIILTGFEIVPYFFNAGKAPNFVITHQNAHFTVYGIEDAEVLENMPVTRGFDDWKPHLDEGTAPVQEFVDYIRGHGGVIHAVHLESYQDIWVGGIHATSPPRPSQLYELRGLTGFSVLPESFQIAGAPGGYWDAALVEYLLGARDSVPWAVGDADYHGPEGTLYTATTLYYLKEMSEADVYRCLRDGSMVALQGLAFQDSYVTEFSVSADGKPAEPIMFGKTVELSAPPVVRFSLDHPIDDVTTRLIRNGKVILETADSSFEFIDREVYDLNLPAVYRVEMAGPYQLPPSREEWETAPQSELFVNPIFVYVRK